MCSRSSIWRSRWGRRANLLRLWMPYRPRQRTGRARHGQKADQLPGYRQPGQSRNIALISRKCGESRKRVCPSPAGPLTKCLDAMGTEGGVRALLVFGSNLAVSAPHAGHIQERLDALDFLMVSDFFLSETARVRRRGASLAAMGRGGRHHDESGRPRLAAAAALRFRPTCVRTDVEVLSDTGRADSAMSNVFPSEPREIFEELRRASAGGVADYSGITYERIKREDGVFWPCPGEQHPGTPRMFLDRFATPDGRARFHPIEFRGPAEEPDHEFPLYLTTGRMMAQYQSGTQTRRIAALRDARLMLSSRFILRWRRISESREAIWFGLPHGGAPR